MSEPSPRRPWYLVMTMCLMWMVGVAGAAGAWYTLDHLRGSQELPAAIERSLREQTSPLVHASLLRERARVEAVGKHYRRAFPLALAKLLSSMLLVVASGAALMGRPSARSLAVQVVIANAALAAASFVLLAPARQAMSDSISVELVDHGGALDQKLGRATSIAAQRELELAGQRHLLVLELVVYGATALALGRRRTVAFFQAREAADEAS